MIRSGTHFLRPSKTESSHATKSFRHLYTRLFKFNSPANPSKSLKSLCKTEGCEQAAVNRKFSDVRRLLVKRHLSRTRNIGPFIFSICPGSQLVQAPTKLAEIPSDDQTLSLVELIFSDSWFRKQNDLQPDAIAERCGGWDVDEKIKRSYGLSKT